jgi:hypothetical protein
MRHSHDEDGDIRPTAVAGHTEMAAAKRPFEVRGKLCKRYGDKEQRRGKRSGIGAS